MAKFIEVTVNGIHQLINAEIIEEVRINWDGGVDIYLAFNCPHAVEQDYIKAQESYSVVKKREDVHKMANEKLINQICTIQRGLGIIEGVASGFGNDSICQLLYTATEMIEEAVKEITDGKE